MNVSDAVGKDVGTELQSALDKVGIPHKVSSLINDAVACLFTGLSEDGNTKIGLIVGSGLVKDIFDLVC